MIEDGDFESHEKRVERKYVNGCCGMGKMKNLMKRELKATQRFSLKPIAT